MKPAIVNPGKDYGVFGSITNEPKENYQAGTSLEPRAEEIFNRQGTGELTKLLELI